MEADMGMLGDVYSFIDTKKRQLRGLMSDPLGTIDMGVRRFHEDQQNLQNLFANAYPMAGDRTVLNSPEQIAQFQREAADKAGEMGLAGATVWHGSPHKFDRFDSSKIGTGEGAQAYGHGLYLAESPKVARGYQKSTSYQDAVRQFRKDLPDDADFSDLLEMVKNNELSPQNARVIKELANNDWLGYDYPSQAITAAFKHGKSHDMSPELQQAVKEYGNFYKVDLPDEHIAKMLDWDKPLSQQHPDVQKFLESHPAVKQDVAERIDIQQRLNAQYPSRLTHPVLGKIASKEPSAAGTTGRQAYDTLAAQLGSREAASQALKDAGLPGIRYLDGGSRGAGQGSSNYVVFPGNESMLKIMERNGTPLRDTTWEPPLFPDTTR